MFKDITWWCIVSSTDNPVVICQPKDDVIILTTDTHMSCLSDSHPHWLLRTYYGMSACSQHVVLAVYTIAWVRWTPDRGFLVSSHPADKNSIDLHRLVTSLCCVFAGDQPLLCFCCWWAFIVFSLTTSHHCVFAGDQATLCFGDWSQTYQNCWSPAKPASSDLIWSNIMLACKVMSNYYWNPAWVGISNNWKFYSPTICIQNDCQG